VLDVSGYFTTSAGSLSRRDEISAGLVAASGNPLWHCDDCQQAATSSVAQAGFSAVLAKHPDMIHILIEVCVSHISPQNAR
jgi:hypothetical protein